MPQTLTERLAEADMQGLSDGAASEALNTPDAVNGTKRQAIAMQEVAAEQRLWLCRLRQALSFPSLFRGQEK